MTKIISKSLTDFANTFEREAKKDMNQALYAAQQGLNNTAFQARENLFKKYDSVFTIRNKNFFSSKAMRKGVIVKKADRKKDGLNMTVGLEFPYDWFKIQAFGGSKTPKSLKKGIEHNMLAIPTSRGSVKINHSGRITGSGASRMLSYSLKNPKKTKGHVATPHAFIMKNATSKGKDVIAKRQKGNRSKIDWYFVLQPSLTVKKNWDFNSIIHATFQRQFEKNYQKALLWCLEHPKK